MEIVLRLSGYVFVPLDFFIKFCHNNPFVYQKTVFR